MDWKATLITQAFALLLVIVGALLSPFISSLNERRKERHRIKAALIQRLHTFYSYWIKDMSIHNIVQAKMRETNSLSAAINAKTGADKEHALRKYTVWEKDLFRKTDLRLAVSEKKIQDRSEIESLLVQVRHFYSNKKHDSLELAFRFQLDESYSEYLVNTLQQADPGPVADVNYQKMLKEVMDKAKDKENEMRRERDKLILKVRDIL